MDIGQAREGLVDLVQSEFSRKHPKRDIVDVLDLSQSPSTDPAQQTDQAQSSSLKFGAPAGSVMSSYPGTDSVQDSLRWATAISSSLDGRFTALTLVLGILRHSLNHDQYADASQWLYDWFYLAKPKDIDDPIAFVAAGSGLSIGTRLPEEPAESYALQEFDEGALLVLELARRCAKVTARQDDVSMRHLLGALLLGPESHTAASHAGLIGEKGYSFAQLASDYEDYVSDKVSEDERDRWREWIEGTAPEDVAPEVAEGAAEPEKDDTTEEHAGEPHVAGLLRAGYSADLPDGPDHLDIEDEVQTLGSVILDRNFPPPLSIGLFGDWGTGKSFFIGKMKDWVSSVTSAARAAELLELETAFAPSAPQIEFNAWHYVDANLWASLVTHIFSELSFQLFGRKASTEDVQKREMEQQLFNELQTTEKRVEKLKQAKVVADQLAGDAKLEASAAELNLRSQALGLKDMLLADPGALKKLFDVNPGLKKQLDALTGELGKGKQQVEDLQKFVTDLFDLGGRLRCWFKDGGAKRWVVVGVGVFVIGSWALPLFTEALDEIQLWVTRAVTALTGLATWWTQMRPFMKQANEFLDAAGDVKDTHVAEADRKAKEANEKLVAEERKSRDLAKQIEDSSRGLGLEEFLQERLGNPKYTEQLGIVAMVRQDFEKLTTRLRDEGVDVPLPEAERKKAAAKGEKETERIKVDRVILYIDDLDRCSPDRVVEVLQAVHLLLAVPLFVVVVAADPRWLLHSLDKHYSELLKTEGDRHLSFSDDESSRWESTPQQYLEKIFQIPYTLSTMEKAGFQKLVRSLVEPKVDAPEDDSSTNDDPAGEQRPVTTPDEATEHDVTPTHAEGAEPRPAEPGTDESIQKSEPGTKEGEATITTRNAAEILREILAKSELDAQRREALLKERPDLRILAQLKENDFDGLNISDEQKRQLTEVLESAEVATAESSEVSEEVEEPEWQASHNLTPDTLQMSKEERKFLERLTPLISTPRSAKRMVNIYRLLRATLRGEKLARFEGAADPKGGAAGEYQVVQILLGVLVGHPEVAPEFVRELRAPSKISRKKRIEVDVEAEERLDENDFWGFVELRDPSRPSSGSGNGEVTARDRRWTRLVHALRAMEKVYEAERATRVFASWTGDVARYSFRTGHILRGLGHAPEVDAEEEAASEQPDEAESED